MGRRHRTAPVPYTVVFAAVLLLMFWLAGKPAVVDVPKVIPPKPDITVEPMAPIWAGIDASKKED
jgi:hypothetical protein